MAKVTHVKKARVAKPSIGVEVGQEYWWWSAMVGGRGVKFYSKTKPKPSQLTRSEFWSTVESIRESFEEGGTPEDVESLESLRDEIKDELENLRDETQGKFDNMPEGLQQGDTGQMLESRVASLESAIDSLDGIDFSLDIDEENQAGETDEDRDIRIKTETDEKLEQLVSEISDALSEISD